jgi:hypothetical protein
MWPVAQLFIAIAFVVLALAQAVTAIVAAFRADKTELPAVVCAVMKVQKSKKPDG